MKPLLVRVGNTTVKIYRRDVKGYGHFTVAYYHNGARNREVFGKEANARRRALEVATEIESGRRHRLNLSGADGESYLAAVSVLQPLGVPLHAAVEEYVAAQRVLGDESVLSAAKEAARRRQAIIEKPIRDVVTELLEVKKGDGLSRRYIQTLRSHLTRFADTFGMNIGAVTTALIAEWLRSLGVGARARNNIRMSVVTLFHFARAHGYLPKGVPTEAEQVARAKVRGGEIGILSPQQLARLLKCADEEVTLYLVLGAFTGLRAAELLRLEWSDINMKRGYITVAKHKAKTATRRLVPIQPNLVQWLSRGGCDGRIFVSEKAAKRAIDFAKKQIGKWPTNALRHSYATYRLAATHDAARVALEMGNSPQMLFSNYRELADDQDAAAWFAIVPKKAANIVAFR